MIRDTSAQDKTIKSTDRKLKVLSGGIFGLILVFAVSVYAYPKASALYQSDSQLDASSLRFATVERGHLTQDIAVQGKIVAAVSPTFYARADGAVTLFVRPGDIVTVGQLLVSIESPQLNNLLSQEVSTLDSLALMIGRQKIDTKSQLLSLTQETELAYVDLQAAEREMTRAKVSMESHLISDVEYRQIEVALDKAKLEHEHALQSKTLEQERLEFELLSRKKEHQRQSLVVTELQRQVAELDIHAPFDGIVGTVDVQQKQAVVRNTPLLTAVDMSAFEVEVLIPENYAELMGSGLSAVVSIGNDDIDAALIAVSPEVTNGQVSGRLRFEEVLDGLRQNQRVNTRILIESKSNVLKVKRGPFVNSSGGRIAYKVVGNTAKRAGVSLGVSSVGEIEVLAGLNEGDRIIISSNELFNQNEQLFLNNL